MRKKQMGLTALIPGLPVQVKGSTVNNQLVAEDAKFEGSDLKTAQDVQTGMAPGAMGTSKQVAPDSAKEGQAENRRVVVRILQNKGIAGT